MKIRKLAKGYRRPTAAPHHGELSLTKSFGEVYASAQRNPSRVYSTGAGTQYTLRAALAQRGDHKGERVIRFMRNGQESARAYECCWGHATNCNRTYIDSYTSALCSADMQ